MKKRLLYGFLLITLLLTGCTNKISEEGKEIYKKATSTLSTINSATVDVSVLMKAKEENMTAKLSTELSFINKKDLALQGTMSFGANGIKIDDIATYYLKNKTMYLTLMDSKKISLPLGELLDTLPTQASKQPTDRDIEMSYKEISLEEKDNKYFLHLVVNPAFLDTITSSYNETQKATNMQIDFSKYTFDMIVNKDHMLEEVTMNMEPTYIMNNVNTTIDITLKINLKNINNVKEIKFPNLKGYPKASEDTLQELLDYATSSSLL